MVNPELPVPMVACPAAPSTPLTWLAWSAGDPGDQAAFLKLHTKGAATSGTRTAGNTPLD